MSVREAKLSISILKLLERKGKHFLFKEIALFFVLPNRQHQIGYSITGSRFESLFKAPSKMCFLNDWVLIWRQVWLRQKGS